MSYISNVTANTKNLEFHIKSNDYFGTLATVLDLAAQINEESLQAINKSNRQLKNIKNNLLFLQERYRIVKK